jgi:hypothetical protein
MTASTVLDEDSAYLEERPEINMLNYFSFIGGGYDFKNGFCYKPPPLIEKAP